MKIRRHLTVTRFTFAILALSAISHIWAKPPGPTPTSPVIYSVKVDRDLDILIITGNNLHNGSDIPAANLSGDPLTNNFFDPLDETILSYDLPAVLPDGHLELTLDSPKGIVTLHIGVKVSDSILADVATNALSADHALQADQATFATNAQDAVNATQAQDADTVDGFEAFDLEESAEIDADIAAHAANTNAHHVAFTNASNTGIGVDSLQNVTTAIQNTATGTRALSSNTTGNNNTANGFWALRNNTTGGENTAIGYTSLFNNTWGTSNSALGYGSLLGNTSGAFNTALGRDSLRGNTTGGTNTSVGSVSMWNNTTGRGNTALGYRAGYNATGDNNILISNEGVINESGVIRIGTLGTQTETYVAGINGAALSGSTISPVIIDENGQLAADASILITDFSELTGSAIDDQIPNDITINFAASAGSAATAVDATNAQFATNAIFADNAGFAADAGDADTLDGIHASELEESAEIDADIASHAANSNAHHTAFTSGTNSALGNNALTGLTTGNSNVAVGFRAMESNQTGSSNIALGSVAMGNATGGNHNIAIDSLSLYSNTTGFDNIAIGQSALRYNTSGYVNIAIGNAALWQNTTGRDNVAIGNGPLRNNTTGQRNIVIGRNAGINFTTGNDNIAIANTGVTGDSAVIRIGGQSTHAKTFIAGIHGGNPLGTRAPVVVDEFGQLGSDPSILTTSFTELTDTAIDDQIPDDITINQANHALTADTATFATSAGSANTATTAANADFARAADTSNIANTATFATSAGDSETVDGLEGADLEESAEIDADIATHEADSNAHHSAFTTPNNTSLGVSALASLTSGEHNVAIGSTALESNLNGIGNIAIGSEALADNTVGGANIAIGWRALNKNTTGGANIAIGDHSFIGNTEGSTNTAIGPYSMTRNTTGNGNTAIGSDSLTLNTEGSLNTAIGLLTLSKNTIGERNVAIGYQAGRNSLTGDDNVFVVNSGYSSDSGIIRIGTEGVQTKAFIAGVHGTSPSGRGLPVVIDENGQLGTGQTEFAIFRDMKPNGTHGGDALVGWNIRDLNNDAYPQFAHPSIVLEANNQFRLMPGLYHVEGASPLYATNRSVARVRNVTDPLNESTAILGQSTYSANSSQNVIDSILATFDGYIEVTNASGDLFEIQNYCSDGQLVDGLGVMVVGSGEPEVYTTVTITRLH